MLVSFFLACALASSSDRPSRLFPRRVVGTETDRNVKLKDVEDVRDLCRMQSENKPIYAISSKNHICRRDGETFSSIVAVKPLWITHANYLKDVDFPAPQSTLFLCDSTCGFVGPIHTFAFDGIVCEDIREFFDGGLVITGIDGHIKIIISESMKLHPVFRSMIVNSIRLADDTRISMYYILRSFYRTNSEYMAKSTSFYLYLSPLGDSSSSSSSSSYSRSSPRLLNCLVRVVSDEEYERRIASNPKAEQSIEMSVDGIWLLDHDAISRAPAALIERTGVVPRGVSTIIGEYLFEDNLEFIEKCMANLHESAAPSNLEAGVKESSSRSDGYDGKRRKIYS